MSFYLLYKLRAWPIRALSTKNRWVFNQNETWNPEDQVCTYLTNQRHGYLQVSVWPIRDLTSGKSLTNKRLDIHRIWWVFDQSKPWSVQRISWTSDKSEPYWVFDQQETLCPENQVSVWPIRDLTSGKPVSVLPYRSLSSIESGECFTNYRAWHKTRSEVFSSRIHVGKQEDLYICTVLRLIVIEPSEPFLPGIQ
jgi:hypothetical protein